MGAGGVDVGRRGEWERDAGIRDGGRGGTWGWGGGWSQTVF